MKCMILIPKQVQKYVKDFLLEVAIESEIKLEYNKVAKVFGISELSMIDLWDLSLKSLEPREIYSMRDLLPCKTYVSEGILLIEDKPEARGLARESFLERYREV